MNNYYQQPRSCGSMPYGCAKPGCDTAAVSDCPCNMAIANVPMQRFGTLYEPARAIMAGTAFPELDKPFTGRSVRS